MIAYAGWLPHGLPHAAPWRATLGSVSLVFFTETQLADALGVAPAVVAGWRRRYGWPHLRIGRTIRYTVEQVAQIKRMHTVAARQDPARRLQERWGLTERSARLTVGRRGEGRT